MDDDPKVKVNVISSTDDWDGVPAEADTEDGADGDGELDGIETAAAVALFVAKLETDMTAELDGLCTVAVAIPVLS